MDYSKLLNPQQLAAVTSPAAQTLVLAGPGSGKTRVLTQRAAWLIHEQGAYPGSILAVTFTNKAASEMRARLERMLGPAARGMWLGTFHAVCARILRREAETGILPFTRDYVIFDSDDQQALIKRAFKDLNLDEKFYNANSVHDSISRAKNALTSPASFVARTYREEVVKRVYERYESLLRASNALDFDDLLSWSVKLLSENEEARLRYAERFAHILVDEFQDTNQAQYELLKLLSSRHRNLFVVGDEDQSIYRWRGADYRNVQRFEEEYPRALKLLLEENYRSTQTVLDAAQAVINQNSNRTMKNLFTARGKGGLITLHEAVDDHAEADFVARSLKDAQGKTRGSGVAVMYRVNAQSRLLEEALMRFNLPYRLVGAQRFYGRREVKDLIAYLRLTQNPADEFSLLRAIGAPPRGIGDKTLAALREAAESAGLSAGEALLELGQHAEESLLWPKISGRGATLLAKFGAQLAGWRAMMENAILPDLFDKILADSAYREYLTNEGEAGQERWENVLELRRLAVENTENGLSGFLENVALVSDQDTLSDERAAVTLLTLHAAKGLEFNTIYIMGLDENLLPHSRSMDDPEEMEEERRLFYVGITRAEDSLVLSRAEQRSLFGRYEFTQPSRFLDDIPADLIRREGTRLGSTRSRPSVAAAASARWEGPRSVPQPVEPRFKAGQRVLHPQWGEGLVIENRLLDGDEILTVGFDSVGIKRLAASVAKLEIIS